MRNSGAQFTGARLAGLALAGLLCTSCGSDEQTASDPGVTIYPATTPAFDKNISDYVINCATTPSIQMTVSKPHSNGFTYLGTSGNAPSDLSTTAAVTPATDDQFQQTVGLLPGQRFQFSIGNQSTYSVRCLPPDFPPLTTSKTGTPQAQWYVFAPDLNTSATTPFTSYVVITDSNGTPVWWKHQDGPASDAKVLGSDQIVWTLAGDQYVIYNFNGQVLNTLTGNLDGHDLQPTPAGTYYAIQTVGRVCPPDCADMSPWGGSAQAGVLDAEILEIDSNSNVLWTWRTRDHIALSETGEAGWFPGVGDDIIHMNAVEPDGPDGLMFSARHLNAVYHITKSTGAIDWKLGGTPRPESLTVLGDPRTGATGLNVLSGQHDIRRWQDGSISVHDNGTLVNRQPAVMRYLLDLTNHAAVVIQTIQDTRVPSSFCCGSARLLPDGDWLVQWGASPFTTELDATGQPVLTINYNEGATFSYRAVPVVPGIVSANTLRNGMDAMAAAQP